MTQSTTSPSSSAGSSAPKRPSKGIIAAGVGVAAVAVAGGAYAMGAFDSVFGGGKQPADVLPGTSVAYLRLDMNPSAAQKVGAFRLFDKVPEVKSALNNSDPKRAVFEWMAKQDGSNLKDIDYTNDIEPWLGDRAGFAFLAPSGDDTTPLMVAAIQVKDEQKAEEGLQKLSTAISPSVDAATNALGSTRPQLGSTPNLDTNVTDQVRIYQDGYALMVNKDAESRLRAELEAGKLSANENFSGDMKALGDEGVASAWFDQAELMKAANPSSTPSEVEELLKKAGRTAVTIRFNADYLEAANITRGAQQPTANTLTGLGDLPADTGGLYSFSGGAKIVQELWPSMVSLMQSSGSSGTDIVAEAKSSLGINLPEDLETLLGTQFDAVLAKQDFSSMANGQMPKIALRLTTDTAKAQQVLTTMQNATPQMRGFIFPTKVAGDMLLVGLEQSYLDELASPQGKLGDNEGFKRTIPDPDKQAAAVFVDLDAFEGQYLSSVPSDWREAVQSLQAIGVVSSPYNDGESRGSLRLSIN